MVSWLIEKLVELGHEVTLFASGDSVTNARTGAGLTRSSLRDGPGYPEQQNGEEKKYLSHVATST